MVNQARGMYSTVQRVRWVLILCALIGLYAVLNGARLWAAGDGGDIRPQDTTRHFEGGLVPATDGASSGDVIAFDVTYDNSGTPTRVDYQFMISSLVLSETEGPLCAAGGQTTYNGTTENLLPWPGNKMYTFTGDERPGGVYPRQVSITGLLGRSLTGKYIGPNHSQGTVQAFYEISLDGVSFTMRCVWTWKISNGPGGVLSFSQSEYSVGENEGNATITVVRQEVLVGTVTVDYATANISAEESKDYGKTTGSLSFAPGETQKQFTVPILSDDLVEGLETLNLSLSNPSEGAVLDAPNPALLQIDDTPDLAVLSFSLDKSQLAQEGTKFVMKDIVVRVINTADENGETVPQATLQVKNGDTVVKTATVGPLAPGGPAQEVTFDWDVTDLLIAGAGDAQLYLIARVDPGGTLPDRNPGNNSWPAGVGVNVLPVIEKIDPQYELQGRFFLQGVPINNKIDVTVNDWNGDAQGQGIAPYGQLHFKLNQNEITLPGQIGQMDHTYDMGTDFSNAGECFANTLSIWAEGIDPSFLTDPIPPFVSTAVNLPQWVTWVQANLQQYDLKFTARPAGKLVNYAYGFSFPEPPFSPNATVPANVPILGGSVVGFLPPTVASIDTATSSGGGGTVQVTGQTGFTSPVFTGSAQLLGNGETRFRCKQGVPVLDFDKATFGFQFDHNNASQDITLQQMLPGLGNALASVPFWGPELAASVNASTVGVAVDVGGGLTANFSDKGAGELEFDTARGKAQIGLSASSTLQLLDDLSLSITGGGTPYVTVKVPRPPIDYLEQIGIDLAFEVVYQAWSYQGSIPMGVSCSLPGGCGLSVRQTALLADPTGWQLLAPTSGGPDYARFQSGRDIAPRLGENGAAESILLSNIYAYPDPALAVDSSGKRLLAYVHESEGAPQGRGAEVRTLHWNGSAWESPVSVTSDLQPDYNPALAYDGNGKGVLIWERSNLPAEVTPSLDITFTQSLEIVASSWNGSAWSAPTALTANGLMDRAPRLARGGDSTVMALWQTGNGDSLAGTTTDPVALTYALWDGNSWSPAAVAVPGLSDLRQVRLAVRSASDAALVLAKGGNTRSGDTELYYSTFNGTAWSALQPLTANSAADTNPALAYDSAGRRHLVWLENGELRWLVDSWAVANAITPIPAEKTGTIQGLGLAAGPGGALALTWQSNLHGQPGIAHAIYDPAANSWSAPDVLVGDAQVEAHLAPAYAPDGDLHIGYRKTQTALITRTLTLTTSQTITVPNVLTEGQNDLAYLIQTPGRDLTFDSLTVDPANPAPGQPMTLTAVLRNAGGLQAQTPRVRFLDGAALLATQDLAGLDGGYTRTVTVQAVLGAGAGAHTLRAVADPDGQLVESDESNNEVTLVTSLPDLRPGLLSTTSSSTIVSVTVAVENIGAQATTTGFTVTLRADHPLTGTSLAENQLVALAAGQQATTTLVVAAADLSTSEPIVLWVVVDGAGQVAENDESNNSRSGSFSLLPDLAVTSQDIGPGSGQLEIAIHNRGQRPSIAMAVWIGTGSTPPTGASAFHKATIGAIPAGGSHILSVPMASGSDIFAVKVDADDSVAEIDEANNLAFRRLRITELLYLPVLTR